MRVLARAARRGVRTSRLDRRRHATRRAHDPGYGDNSKHTLVMSDEFETPHRSFKDGEDPRWTAVHKNDYTNKALQYYLRPTPLPSMALSN